MGHDSGPIMGWGGGAWAAGRGPHRPGGAGVQGKGRRPLPRGPGPATASDLWAAFVGARASPPRHTAHAPSPARGGAGAHGCAGPDNGGYPWRPASPVRTSCNTRSTVHNPPPPPHAHPSPGGGGGGGAGRLPPVVWVRFLFRRLRLGTVRLNAFASGESRAGGGGGVHTWTARARRGGSSR